MLEKLTLSGMAQSLAAHSAAQLSVVARNIANVDTPDYKAMELPSFSEVYQNRSDMAGGMRATRIGHLHYDQSSASLNARMSDGLEEPNGNNVSLDLQMMKTAETQQHHEMALSIYSSVSSILRTSLGQSGR